MNRRWYGALLGALALAGPAFAEGSCGTSVEFVDSQNNKRAGKVHLQAVQTVTAGIAFGRPYSEPFSVR